jgi:hypothetical protein
MKADPNRYPPGLNYDKAAAIAKLYDEQSEAEVITEIEAAAGDTETVMVQVPRTLLPAILHLIDAGRESA